MHSPSRTPLFHHRLLWFVFVFVLFGMGFFLYSYFFSPSFISPVLSPIDSGCVGIDRSSYGISPLVFSLLPSPPSCFHSVIAAEANDKLPDGFELGESYYLQPEYFPSFTSDGLKVWQDPVATHYGAVGYGTYPIRSTLFLSPSSESTVRFFLFSGFGIRTLQQARITYSFHDPLDEGLVTVSLDEESANGFLLGPTFPVFTRQWVKPIVVRVSTPTSLPHPVVVVFHVSSSNVDFSSDPLTHLFPLFDATTYVGERDVYALTIAPPT